MKHIVVGANYGDEGKGLITDFLTRTHDVKRVIRFNGGAQASHTVTTDNQRHAFSSFSSGTLAGAVTELTGDVILNPFAATVEALSLIQPPKIRINHRVSPITTPFEIALNQAAEAARGNARHGSCGLGINETIERHLAAITAGYGDITRMDSLKWLSEEWLPKRGAKLGIPNSEIHQIQNNSRDRIGSFLDTWEEANEVAYTDVMGDYQGDEHIVYEGAQGLALDEDLGDFPFVTRSNTGIRNALRDIVRRMAVNGVKKETVRVVYVTRAYLTRHGTGPLRMEMPAEQVTCGRRFGEGRFVDMTNQPNPWQGTLRFAPLDLYAMYDRIQSDINRNLVAILDPTPPLEIKVSIALTCMDQMKDILVVKERNGMAQKIAVTDLPKMIYDTTGFEVITSHGPTYLDVNNT